MKRLKGIILLIGALFSYNLAFTNIIVVSNTLNTGIGSLRNAVSLASKTANDTILINVKGTITLNSTINIDDFDALTIIGAFPKHTTITSAGSWTGSFFNLNSCEDVIIRGIGFVGGTGTSRHISVDVSDGEILFERCLFEGNATTFDGGAGEISNSEVKFSKCSFIDNAANDGGALYIKSSSHCVIENCTFSDNVATGNSGAIRIESSSEVDLLFNTIIRNLASDAPQAIESIPGTTVTLENNAIGFNGAGEQIILNGTATTYGGNRVRLNGPGQSGTFPTVVSDTKATGLDFGLRTTMKTDGFGLKYWPIINPLSVLINPKITSASSPKYDCRNAPRSLKGSGSLVYADAGACEYTHLRVTNTSGLSTDPNSFLWAMSAGQRKDEIHYIEFDIDIVGAATINPLANGTMTLQGYIIDGFSQQGSAIPGPAIVGGTGLTPAILNISLVKNTAVNYGVQFGTGTDSSIVQGLRIQGFNNSGIAITSRFNSVYGCEVGINELGIATGNLISGITLANTNNKIGGWEHWMRNVVSGNGSSSDVSQPNLLLNSANNNKIQGNIIGGAANGNSLITAPFHTRAGISGGIITLLQYNLFGGSLINTGNIIIGNQTGIHFGRFGDYNKFEGNKIGVGWDGLTAFGNTIAGISFNGCDDNIIGGLSPKQANIIAHNSKGIVLKSLVTISERILIVGNSIYLNGGQGIDFEDDDAVEPNDGALNAAKQNRSLDYPELLFSENCDGTNTKTNYRLSVPTGATYRVEFFKNSSPDLTNGEGEQFIGSQTVTVLTNPQVFTYVYPGVLSDGTSISATVSTNNATSEFGTNVLVIDERVATISYTDTCPGDPLIPIISEDFGGIFDFMDPEPMDGAVIDPTSGEITDGVEGITYEVVYSFLSGCSNKDTASATVIEVVEGFTFDDFCAGIVSPAPIPDSVSDLFTFIDLLDGSSINGTTGVISSPVEGTTYTVTHTATNLGCTQSAIETVTVTNVDEYFEFEDICFGENGFPEAVATPGGTFSIVSPIDLATINSITGEFSGGVADETYVIRYVALFGGCADSMEVPITVNNPNSNFTFPDFCPSDASPAPTPEVPGGVFNFTVIPLAGEVIITETGVIENPVEGESYEVSYEVVVDGCSSIDTITTNAIEVIEGFTFADFCHDTESPAPITAGAPGLFSMIDLDDGATIISSSGIIVSPVEGTTYTVTHTATNLGCSQSETETVNVTNVDEYFEFDDLCFGDIGFPEAIATPGGTFSIVTPLDAAIIDPTTGEFSGGLGAETYTIRYIANVAGCADTLDLPVLINDPNANFLFPDFCSGSSSPAPTAEVPGGEFSFATAPLSGETINADSGIIENPVEGASYEVSYEVVIDGCVANDTVMTNVIVVPQEFTASDFCWNNTSPPAIPVAPGGTFSFGFPLPVDGATINSLNGQISEATEGVVYEILHSLSVGICTQADSVLVTAVGVNESFVFADFCPHDDSPAPIPATSGGTYSFSGIVVDGATINPLSGIISEAVEGTSYLVAYSVSEGSCTENSEVLVTVISTDESFSSNSFCAEFASVAPIPAVPGGVFSFEPFLADGATIDLLTGIITGANPGVTYGVKYTVGICNERDTNFIFAKPSEIPSFVLDDFCLNLAVAPTIDGTPAGTFDFNPLPVDAAIIEPTTGLISNTTGGTYTIRYITPGSDVACQDTLEKIITVYPVPELTSVSSDVSIYCPYDEIGPMLAVGDDNSDFFYWYFDDLSNPILDSFANYTPPELNLGNNLYIVQPKSEFGCFGDPQSYNLFLSDTAGMRAISDFDVCLGSPAQLEAYNGISYWWITDIPLADYTDNNPVAFSLNPEIYRVIIKNTEGCEVTDSVKVSFLSAGDCEIIVYNAFSPNEDGKNDFWYIENLINFIPNTVYIYTRWGDKLMEIENYDNINNYWKGQDKRGNDLPPGTYFYVVITENEELNHASWVQLVR